MRIYATPDGASHFGDVDIPMAEAPLFPNEAAFELSGHYPASRIRFVRIPRGVQEAGWHTPPGRVLAVWLDGVVEFEVSDGETKTASAGEFVLVEDTHGKGHISRHPIDGQTLILISLPNGLDPPPNEPGFSRRHSKVRRRPDRSLDRGGVCALSVAAAGRERPAREEGTAV